MEGLKGVKRRVSNGRPTWRLVQSASQFDQGNEVKMLSLLNLPGNFFRHKQNHGATVKTQR